MSTIVPVAAELACTQAFSSRYLLVWVDDAIPVRRQLRIFMRVDPIQIDLIQQRIRFIGQQCPQLLLRPAEV